MPDDSTRSTMVMLVGICAIFALALGLIIFEPRAARWVAVAVEAEFANSDQAPEPPAPQLAETPHAR